MSGTANTFASTPASSSISKSPTGRAGTTEPGGTGIGVSTNTSTGSPSSANVFGMKP